MADPMVENGSHEIKTKILRIKRFNQSNLCQKLVKLYVKFVPSFLPKGTKGSATVRSASTKRLAGCDVYEINRDDIAEWTR